MNKAPSTYTIKTLVNITAYLVISGIFGASTAFATEERQRNISVSGQSEIRVAPDQMLISMSIMNKEKTLEVAKENNDKTVTSLINYLSKTLNIDPKHIQTDFLSVEPIYYRCSNSEEREGLCDSLKINYYSLSKGIQLRLDDLSKYEAVVAQSLALGVNKINDIQFITTKLRQHKDKARELATIAAKEKAEAIVKTLDMTLGKPSNISLQNVGWRYSNNESMTQNSIINVGGASMEGDSSLAIGQINVTASVNIVFDMK